MRILSFAILLLALTLPVRAEESTEKLFDQQIKPLLAKYCMDCHGPDTQEGEIRFDRMPTNPVTAENPERWHDVLNQISAGEMPPQDSDQPSPEERQILSDWLQRFLREAAAAKRYRNGRVVTRRLTRYEYANTMRDLLEVDLDYAKDLPPEPASSEGFRNNSSTLEMSPTQIETYLKTARQGLAEAIVTGEPPKLYEFSQSETARGRLPNRKFAGHEPVRPEFVLDLNEFPRHGKFELNLTVESSIPEGRAVPRIHVTLGHVPGIIHVPRGVIGDADVRGGVQTLTFTGRMEDFPQPGPIAFGNSGFKGMIVMVDFLDADGHELRYDDRQYVQPQPQPKPKKKGKVVFQPLEAPKPPTPFGSRLELRVVSAEFRAPVYASWPPQSHTEIFSGSDQVEDETQKIRHILQPFMTKAFRRPATSEEVKQTAHLFEVIRPQCDSFEEAVRETLASVLVSPHFLYVVEQRDESGTGEPQPLNDYELASRLSYFLWSSMPDERLFRLAAQQKLHHPEVLTGEVERMLTDARASEFVEHFVDQWLDLDALNRVAVNPEFYPDFDDDLKSQMRLETHHYFSRVLTENRSALELLDSDWAMLNYSLAKHYGLTGPRSAEFVPVSLSADNPRGGGLLTQGSYLLANSNGEDSHPIKRAVWILDRLLDSPPAPPPPDVPELDAERPDLAKLTLKEQLASIARNSRATPAIAASIRGAFRWKTSMRWAAGGQKFPPIANVPPSMSMRAASFPTAPGSRESTHYSIISSQSGTNGSRERS
ncbi:MAG: DUF1592 domain-containing protein [Planctomycetaceae bacterium]|nr:DUF1592 domain-containing protein [Planctomycetaceae bacterium]